MTHVINPPVVAHFPQTEVFNALPPAAMTDLDVSAVVGARRAVVLLRILNSTGANTNYRIRRNGETVIPSAPGMAHQLIANGNFGLFETATSDAGIIEHYSSNVAGTVVISVEAYIHA